MTLLESLVALVILGVAAVAFLGALHVTSSSTRDMEVWLEAVGYAESTMELTKLGAGAATALDVQPTGFSREVTETRWVGGRGLDEVTVTVALPEGGHFEVHRLVRAP